MKELKYLARDEKCKTKKCFVPYSGNGIKICRLYELGKCPGIKSKNQEEK